MATNLTADLETVQVKSCEKCHFELDWADCTNCGGEGVDGHDCGDDCCCCAWPEDNLECDICEGDGGWWACPMCSPGAFND